jgi:ABC-2 type transport system ATP-binding protein
MEVWRGPAREPTVVTDIAIHTEDLTRDFGPVRALDSLTLTVPAGVVFGFLGTNGAGKTTTIRLLLGLLAPTHGHASVLGFDICHQAAAIRERTGALLEHPGIYERLTAEDNLDFYGRVWRIPGRERRARIRELLTHLGLWDRRRQRAGTWSRGMKQKLAIARALLHRPSLLFLDEPTAGLDPVAAAALRDDLANLVRREGVTVFLTTHNLSEAEKLCTLVGVIRQGRLLAVGHPDELRARAGGARAEIVGRGFAPALLAALRARPEVRAVQAQNGRLLIDLHDGVPLAPLVRLAVEAGAEVEEVHRGAPSLEEAFLTLMEHG